MLLDIVAWAFILGTAYLAGTGVLALLGAHDLRRGDRFIIASWCGVTILSATLLGASIAVPLSPLVGLACAAAIAAVGVWLRRGFRDRHRNRIDEPHLSAGVIAVGVAIVVVGAGAFASDRVTLHDSLVYHLGIIRWLREHGTVPGVALIHNRLGHVSAWFALDAPFDSGDAAGRASNIGLGVALLLVALQGAIAASRITARRASGADWFLFLSSVALIWPAVCYDFASPSPDVAASALIIVVAWSMLVVPHDGEVARRRPWARGLDPRLVPFILGVGAAAMKLFALPAAVAGMLFYALGRGVDRDTRYAALRLATCIGVGSLLFAPFLAASVVASGCPLFPSPIACLDVPWSVGAAPAADYAVYIRDVARFESRRDFSGAAELPWIGPWIAAHPLVTGLVVIAPLLAVVLLRGPRRDGVRSALLLAMLGIALAAWQAPAPRFFYAFAIIAPAIAAADWLGARSQALRRGAAALGSGPLGPSRAGATGFVAFAALAAGAYALASQKLNLLSSLKGDRPALVLNRQDLLIPRAPEGPARLYRWRVNDVDVFTPVPRPVVDTLSYRSVVDADAGLEKCSTAPLPCTPYLPPGDLHLRVPARGFGGGFARDHQATRLSAVSSRRCLGDIVAPFAAARGAVADPAAAETADRCGEATPRSPEPGTNKLVR
jgi:hypothetical protein